MSGCNIHIISYQTYIVEDPLSTEDISEIDLEIECVIKNIILKGFAFVVESIDGPIGR